MKQVGIYGGWEAGKSPHFCCYERLCLDGLLHRVDLDAVISDSVRPCQILCVVIYPTHLLDKTLESSAAPFRRSSLDPDIWVLDLP